MKLYILKTVLVTVACAIACGHSSVRQSATDVVLTVGGGISRWIGAHVSIDVDLRYLHLITTRDLNVGRLASALSAPPSVILERMTGSRESPASASAPIDLLHEQTLFPSACPLPEHATSGFRFHAVRKKPVNESLPADGRHLVINECAGTAISGTRAGGLTRRSSGTPSGGFDNGYAVVGS